jgi:cytoplasmic iron level regulating protein YaaA (DUF328/UPF0246 family)
MRWLYKLYDKLFPKRVTPKGKSLAQYFQNELNGIVQDPIEEYDKIIVDLCDAVKGGVR